MPCCVCDWVHDVLISEFHKDVTGLKG